MKGEVAVLVIVWLRVGTRKVRLVDDLADRKLHPPLYGESWSASAKASLRPSVSFNILG
jgi:hypothetical protein